MKQNMGLIFVAGALALLFWPSGKKEAPAIQPVPNNPVGEPGQGVDALPLPPKTDGSQAVPNLDGNKGETIMYIK